MDQIKHFESDFVEELIEREMLRMIQKSLYRDALIFSSLAHTGPSLPFLGFVGSFDFSTVFSNVNNRTDALKTEINLFSTITSCQIVRSRSLTPRINYKFMCLSAY